MKNIPAASVKICVCGSLIRFRLFTTFRKLFAAKTFPYCYNIGSYIRKNLWATLDMIEGVKGSFAD